jgi:hypothetical protein
MLVHLRTNSALPILLICHATCQTIKLLQEVARIHNFLEIAFMIMDWFFKISHEISLEDQLSSQCNLLTDPLINL